MLRRYCLDCDRDGILTTFVDENLRILGAAMERRDEMSTKGRSLTVELLTPDEKELIFAIDHTIDRFFEAKYLTGIVGCVFGLVTLMFFVFFSGFSFGGMEPGAFIGIQFGVGAGAILFGTFLAHFLYFRRRSARRIEELRRWAADPRTRLALEKLTKIDKVAGELAELESVRWALKHPSPLVARHLRRLSLALPE